MNKVTESQVYSIVNLLEQYEYGLLDDCQRDMLAQVIEQLDEAVLTRNKKHSQITLAHEGDADGADYLPKIIDELKSQGYNVIYSGSNVKLYKEVLEPDEQYVKRIVYNINLFIKHQAWLAKQRSKMRDELKTELAALNPLVEKDRERQRDIELQMKIFNL